MQPVRFSVIAGPRQRPDRGQTASEAWSSYVDDVVRAEQLGFDSAFIGEHHFCFAQGNSSPLVFLTECAARTERIRLGTSVLCAPFHNPLRVAEDIAAVDIVSRGRFELGVGVGSQWEEFETFGIDPKERFGRTWEALDIIERCLHGEEEQFTHEGKYFHLPDVRWILPPVQERIPIWWGGFGPQGVTRAAKRGYHLIAPDVTGAYSRTLRELGQRPEDRFIGFVTMVSVAATREDAFEAIGEAATWVNEQYLTRRNLDGAWPDPSARVGVDEFRQANEENRQVGMFTPIADTVDGVIERLLPLARGALGPMNHFGVEFHPPGTDPAHVKRSMTLFAQEVIPIVRAEAEKYRAQTASAA